MRENPTDGVHAAKINGQVVIYEAASGALCAAIPIKIPGDDNSPEWMGKHTETLVKSDGTVQARTIDNIKKWSGWDGCDPFWLMDQDFSSIDVETTGGSEEYAKDGQEPVMVYKIKYLNPVGGGRAAMPEAADRKSILAKYGARFRAMSGGAASKPNPAPAGKAASATSSAASKPTEKPKEGESQASTLCKSPAGSSSAKPPVKAPTKKPAAKSAQASDLESAWAACQANNSEMSEEDQGQLFYATIEKMFSGKSHEDLTPEEFGALKEKFEDNVS